MIGSSNRSTTNAYSSKFVGICTLLLATITCQISVAQDWPINSPEAYEPVPQYEPQRYPLANQPVTTQGPAASPSQSPVSLPASQSQTNQLIQSENVLPANEPVKVASPQKSKSAAHQPNGNQVNWEIYRDRNPHPIDPRKPCNNCTHPHGTQPRCNCNLPGVNGRSYIEREPGGCQCDQKNPSKHPEFTGLDHFLPNLLTTALTVVAVARRRNSSTCSMAYQHSKSANINELTTATVAPAQILMDAWAKANKQVASRALAIVFHLSQCHADRSRFLTTKDCSTNKNDCLTNKTDQRIKAYQRAKTSPKL